MHTMVTSWDQINLLSANENTEIVEGISLLGVQGVPCVLVIHKLNKLYV